MAFAVLGVVVLALVVPDLRTAEPATSREPLATDRCDGGPHGARLSDLVPAWLRRLLVVAGLLGLVTVGDGFIYLACPRPDHSREVLPAALCRYQRGVHGARHPAGPSGRPGRAGTGVLGGHVPCSAVYALTAGGLGRVSGRGGRLLLLGSFYAATDGVLAALATQSVPEESRASGIAAAQTVVALARFGCSVGFGLLWQLTGPAERLYG